MNANAVNEIETRGKYLGSQVARIDERGIPVDWRLAIDHDDAVALARQLAEDAPDQQFAVYDGYLEASFARGFA
ncbi:hypothetical protein OOJ09_25995 [Mesorhizobium qingshengii]|uniref:Uncharacterized protein n=1 Tax=Mesorhizobium qingshengii TaxID=1165689 RepID=A0ABT4R1C3_9HYPH|nr:hypothetical protein [Mesorhizobium qingshengii]MCZ8547653.1 hypothetical protein [Mesorhizobium qingshengii]